MSATPPTDRATVAPLSGTGWLLLGYAGVLALVLLPIILVDIPPLVDYLSHLARLHVLSTLDSDPALQSIYRANWAILPNLAMEMVALPLAKLAGPVAAGRLFIALTVVLLVVGTAALHRAVHGRLSPWPLAAAFFVYNHLLYYGFLNYLFGLGLMFCAFAGWIATHRMRPLPRVAMFTVVATVLFFSHLLALAIYGLLVLGHEVWRYRRIEGADASALARHWIPVAAPFVVPAVLMLFTPTGGQGTASVTSWGAITDKLRALLSPVLFFHGTLDLVAFVFAGWVAAKGVLSKSLTVAPEIRYPLVALCLLAPVAPNWLFNTWGADFRLPLAIVLVFIAATRLEVTDRRVVLGVGTVAALLLVLRVGEIAIEFRGYDARFAEFRERASVMAPGSRLLVVNASADVTTSNAGRAYTHLASLAILDRAIFTPAFFTDPLKQPVTVTDAFRTLDVPYGNPVSPQGLELAASREGSASLSGQRMPGGFRVFWAGWPDKYDYVLAIHDGAWANPLPALLEKAASGSYFDIYRVIRRPRS